MANISFEEGTWATIVAGTDMTAVEVAVTERMEVSGSKALPLCFEVAVVVFERVVVPHVQSKSQIGQIISISSSKRDDSCGF